MYSFCILVYVQLCIFIIFYVICTCKCYLYRRQIYFISFACLLVFLIFKSAIVSHYIPKMSFIFLYIVRAFRIYNCDLQQFLNSDSIVYYFLSSYTYVYLCTRICLCYSLFFYNIVLYVFAPSSQLIQYTYY